MKYIRTENGIYDTTKGLYTPSLKMFAIGTKTIYEKDIIKQADTIEELCDEFVVVKTDNPKITKPFVIDKYDTDFIKESIKRGSVIKGAIWTNKGLIYVDKEIEVEE